MQIAAAIIAGLVTYAILDLVLGRPLLKLVWLQGGRAVLDRRPDLNLRFGHKRVLRVDVMMEGRTPVAMFVGWLALHHKLHCNLTMRPRETARCVRQASP